MGCTLYLVRHGIAAPADGADAERSLTPEGARKMTRAALGLKRLGIVPDAVLSSPLRRAGETAALVVAAVAPELRVEVFAQLAPGHSPAEVISALRPYRGARHIMLVGHQPGLGELASYLLTESPSLVPLPFKKGAVAAIEVGSLPPRRAGTLEWFLTPKQLRLVGRRGS